jgi:hypothetical protein
MSFGRFFLPGPTEVRPEVLQDALMTLDEVSAAVVVRLG